MTVIEMELCKYEIEVFLLCGSSLENEFLHQTHTKQTHVCRKHYWFMRKLLHAFFFSHQTIQTTTDINLEMINCPTLPACVPWQCFHSVCLDSQELDWNYIKLILKRTDAKKQQNVFSVTHKFDHFSCAFFYFCIYLFSIFVVHFQPEKLNVYKNDSDTSWDYTLTGKHISLKNLVLFLFLYCKQFCYFRYTLYSFRYVLNWTCHQL